MVEKIDFRLVRANGSIYLRKEDVIEYLLWLAAGEETDTRNRLEEAAKKIEALGVDTTKLLRFAQRVP